MFLVESTLGARRALDLGQEEERWDGFERERESRSRKVTNMAYGGKLVRKSLWGMAQELGKQMLKGPF